MYNKLITMFTTFCVFNLSTEVIKPCAYFNKYQFIKIFLFTYINMSLINQLLAFLCEITVHILSHNDTDFSKVRWKCEVYLHSVSFKQQIKISHKNV